uniref:PGG domain-containing protein n=2 Tax=Manihot esculenta TaxID=3983 RepID=A0A2C9W2J5_MANES
MEQTSFFSDNEQSQEAEEEKETRYLPLYKAALRGDWITAKRIFDDDPAAVTAKISGIGEITLHVAISRGRSSLRFIQMLVELMPEHSLETTNIHGETPLHYAAIAGNIQAISLLVKKNPALLQIVNFDGLTPLHFAAQCCHKEAVSLLLSIDLSALSGRNGVRLVNLLIIAESYDTAFDLLRRYPNLAIGRDDQRETALETLARKPHAFPSGSKLGFCERLLYRFVSVDLHAVHRDGDLENRADVSEASQKESKKFGLLDNIRNTKLKHNQALELLSFLITEALKARPSETRMLLKNPLFTAATADRRNIFHLAIIHRQKFIFSILKGLSPQNKHLVTSSTDHGGDNVLHLAARLGPLDEIPGAALQMHSDMQWFKEVETIVEPFYREMRNRNGMTPGEIFRQEHKNLAREAEQWMKTIASSCMVVPTLVVTVTFAAAFTVPGGNTQDTGIPIYLKETSFMIFAVSDALAFFSTSASLLMFICIFNLDYSEEITVRTLKLFILGFITLFFSIVTMFAAFGASLYIVLSHRVEWVAAPIGLLACVPVALFAYFQFPQWYSVAYSAFKPSIIAPQTEEIIF